MKLPTGTRFWILAGSAVLGFGWFFEKWKSPGFLEENVPVTESRPLRLGSADSIPGTTDDRWRVEDASGGGFRVSFDWCMRRLPDGSQHLQGLVPSATRSTLRARLAGLDALPVVHREGEGDQPAAMQVVTRDLRLRVEGDEAAVLAQNRDLTLKSRPAYAPGWLVLSAADALAALDALSGLRATSGVSSADVLLAKQQIPRLMPNDPLIHSQWHLKNSGTASAGTDVNVETAWDYATGHGVRGKGITIGIVDDGVDLGHEDLVPNLDLADGWDWNGNDSNPSAAAADKHGTACAGNAAARGNNGLGGSGVAPEAKLVGLRLIAAPATDEQEAEAMVWKQDLIQIKNNSWGPSDTGRTLEEPGPLAKAALQSATSSGRGGLGTVFVWAAGNGASVGDNSNSDGYANSIYTIAVGAVDSTGNASDYSENGANILVCAPSDGAVPALGIITTDLIGSVGYNTASSAAGGDYTDDFGGTSSATPVVAGVVALMLEKNPLLGWRDVQEILIRSATKFRPTDSGWAQNGAGIPFHPGFGAGLVNASAAVNLARGWTNLPSQTVLSQSAPSGTLSIPENSATGATRTFTFPDANLRVEHVTVTLDVSHTSRGNLQITLTSPAGTSSRLAEVHNDGNDNITHWTYSSVHHWGEQADGTWTLRICDLSSAGNTLGGTLNASTIRLHGAEVIPSNPPPSVAIASPAPASVFSPGASVQVTVAVTDLNVDGTPGSIAEVVLMDNGTTVETLFSPPYQFRYVPAGGGHQLVARAIDGEGASSDSPAVPISVENRPPFVTAVDLGAVGQAYADRDLRVQSVIASDPDGELLEYHHQWQSSIDGNIYQNEAGADSEILPSSPANAGRLWRCQVTASDGIQTSPPFDSSAVNLLTRPASSVSPGATYFYQSGLVLRGDPAALQGRALIHEFSQGPAGGNSEWVEILVLKKSDMGYWDLSDTTNKLVFSASGIWNAIPAGTLVVIYNGNTIRDPVLPADDTDPSDATMVVSSKNPAYFDSSFDSWIPLANNGDSITLNDSRSVAIHSLCYGNSTGAALNIGSVASGRASFYAGDTEAGANAAAGWQTTVVAGAVTPGIANNQANAAFIAALKAGTVSIPSRFRLAAGSVLPAGLLLDPVSGSVSGTVDPGATAGDYLIEIERTNNSGGMVSQAFVLTVGPAGGYEAWISGFSPAGDISSEGDPDCDGLPNLIEYAEGTSPVIADPRVVPDIDGAAISIVYSRSKIHSEVELLPEWSASMATDAAWSGAGITIQLTTETGNRQWFRATLPIDSAHSKRFLRLKAFRVR